MLVLALAKLHASMGHESAVVAMFPAEADFNTMIAEQQKLGIEWIAPVGKLGRIARLIHLRKANRKFKPDVVFAHSVLPAAYARVSGLTNVISVLHDASENDYGSGHIALAERALQYLSMGVIAVSPRAAENYSKRYVAPPVVCIPNGIALATYQNAKLPDKTKLLTSLGLPVDAVVALQVGRITGIKQQYLSVRAMAPLIEKNSKIHLLLAGIYEDTESLSALKTEIHTHNLAANVHLIGPRDDIPKLLQLASVYLMPSKQEAHSVALIEALASGISVVASDIPPFEYVRSMAGIALTNPNMSHLFGQAIEKMLVQSQRYSRDLTRFDIFDTATKYIFFQKKCAA
jgi:glycosyltransferase involved in cell wall biosynthesis